uniref:Uncharacterized protein n=1 Tax=Glossina austeni TaxID=7395 RepID=A0A1A9VWN7_GLOAU
MKTSRLESLNLKKKKKKQKRIEQHLLRTYIEINRRQKLKLDLMGVLQKQNKKDLILKLINSIPGHGSVTHLIANLHRLQYVRINEKSKAFFKTILISVCATQSPSANTIDKDKINNGQNTTPHHTTPHHTTTTTTTITTTTTTTTTTNK